MFIHLYQVKLWKIIKLLLMIQQKLILDPENGAWFFKLKIKDKSLNWIALMNKEEYDKFAKESGN